MRQLPAGPPADSPKGSALSTCSLWPCLLCRPAPFRRDDYVGFTAAEAARCEGGLSRRALVADRIAASSRPCEKAPSIVCGRACWAVVGLALVATGAALLVVLRDQPAASPGGARPQPSGGQPRPPEPAPAGPLKLTRPGEYDLRAHKFGRVVGCKAPIALFPGNAKYGCGGAFSTAQTCDAAPHPVKDTKYVAAVHRGCRTAQGLGTYAYAYDDGVGLRQCAPVTKYEWVLCPTGQEPPISWEAVPGKVPDSTARFRVTNRCSQPIWIQQDAGTAEKSGAETVVRIGAGASYTFSIPNRGLPATRYLPKVGCDDTGNACDIQSLPPCPPDGCDQPIDTKFEATWGCLYAKNTPEDKTACELTAQGNPTSFQDWWDGSAVDGFTLPFSVLTDNAGRNLDPADTSSGHPPCGGVDCAALKADDLCPSDEFLTP